MAAMRRLPRRAALAISLATLPPPVRRCFAAPGEASEITTKARLGFVVGDQPQRFITLGLYGSPSGAPSSVATFNGLCDGTLAAAPGVSYAGSAVTQIVTEQNYLVAGKPAGDSGTDVQKSIDRTGYVRAELVNKADRLVNSDAPALSHDRRGLVSMRRGGGEFD